MDNQTELTPEEQDTLNHPGQYLTPEEFDEIGAARHAFSYPGIVSIRRRIREHYTSASGVHYAGAEDDADVLLEIVDQLYEANQLLIFEQSQRDNPDASTTETESCDYPF